MEPLKQEAKSVTSATVICGANDPIQLDDVYGLSVREIRNKLTEVLNITEDHAITLVNGKQITNPDEYLLIGGEEVEFKKPAGQKG